MLKFLHFHYVQFGLYFTTINIVNQIATSKNYSRKLLLLQLIEIFGLFILPIRIYICD